MARSSFVSFHYQRDHWRVQQILRMGALDQQTELPAQKWEEVKKQGDHAIHAWIDEEMKYKQAVIVLIGNQTASRKFVKYEISRAWSIKKPLLGIRIHGLKDAQQHVDRPGADPFASFGFSDSTKTYADYVPVYDPADYTGKYSPTSSDIYAAIKQNIATWAAGGYKRP
ncbi:TIR domain-containing protein [Arsenicicoccus bolidensis]|uniref:TIR domain-containing protein n=1 Tax=Arsenicicoccus bolidensis TaxID=229480 RepID=UPI0004927FF2|nr:TIR domain-containing protein [Arsenicicoccus bolidensis]